MNIKYSELEPSEELESVVKNYFTLDYNGSDLRTDYFLPNGLVYLFYMKANEDFETHFFETGEKFPTTTGLYVCYLNTLAAYSHKKINSVGVAMYPIYLELLFKDGPNRFMNKLVKIKECDTFSIAELSHMSVEDIMKTLEKFILQHLDKNPVKKELVDIYQRVTQLKTYNTSIKELSESTGYSSRHLNNLFKRHLNVSPKKFVQIVRFNHGLQLMRETGEFKNLTHIANQLGYHDQSHFIKDFKNLCGKTPRELVMDVESASKNFHLY